MEHDHEFDLKLLPHRHRRTRIALDYAVQRRPHVIPSTLSVRRGVRAIGPASLD